MDLISRLRRSAVARPRVLVVDAPGTTLLRWSIEEGIDRRGWSLASSPAETDLLLVLGTPGEELAEAIEVVWSQVPEPRHRVDVEAAGDVGDTLDAALAGLLDGAALPRPDAGGRPGPSTLLARAGQVGDVAGAMDHSAMDHSGHDGMHQSEHGGMERSEHGAVGQDNQGAMDDAVDHDAMGAMDNGAMDDGDMEHAGHGGMDHPDHGSMDHWQHGGMNHGGTGEAGPDHGSHGGMQHPEHGSLDHSQHGGEGHGGHDGMDHSQQGGMGHGGHGGMSHGGMDHGSMDVAGLPMADTAPDRDGLQLDSLQISLGPVLGGWPIGLLLTGRLQGDVLTDVSLRWMDADHGMNEPLHDGGATRAAALDQLVRLLEVAGWSTAARDARRARDRLRSDDPAHVEAGRRLAGQVARRVSCSRTLAWSLRGLGAVDGSDPGGIHGDVLDRVRRWCAIAAGDGSVPPHEPPLDAVAAVLEGAELAAARLVVASLPLLHPVARREPVSTGA